MPKQSGSDLKMVRLASPRSPPKAEAVKHFSSPTVTGAKQDPMSPGVHFWADHLKTEDGIDPKQQHY